DARPTQSRAHPPGPCTHADHRGGFHRPRDRPEHAIPQAETLRPLKRDSVPFRTLYAKGTMTLSLRHRIILTWIPLLVLLTGLGGTSMILLHQLGGRIKLILHENYDSVVAMERLKEALERIDSSFQFALAGREEDARNQFEKYWPLYDKSLETEQSNVTIHPEEDRLVARLTELTKKYRDQGKAFYD